MRHERNERKGGTCCGPQSCESMRILNFVTENISRLRLRSHGGTFCFRDVNCYHRFNCNHSDNLSLKKKPKDISGKVALVICYVFSSLDIQKNSFCSTTIKSQVTGGGNCLGREICLQLAKHGCKIAIADVDFDGAIRTRNCWKT